MIPTVLDACKLQVTEVSNGTSVQIVGRVTVTSNNFPTINHF